MVTRQRQLTNPLDGEADGGKIAGRLEEPGK